MRARRTQFLIRAGVSGLALLASAALTGCYAAPDALSDAGLDLASARFALAPEYWRNDAVPPVAAGQRPRVALAEFTVEYVTAQQYGLLGSRPVVGVDEFTITGRAIDLVGIGRDTVEFDDRMRPALASALRDRFVSELSARGYDVTPAADIAAATSYSGFESLAPGAAYPLTFFNVLGSDTGRPKEILAYPASGLKVIPKSQVDQSAVERRLLDELAADVALRVRLRVGVDSGHGWVGQDSSVRVAWTDPETGELVFGELHATRSILTDEPITLSDDFELLRGDVYRVDPAKASEQYPRIADVFLAMALDRLEPGRPPEMPARSASLPAARALASMDGAVSAGALRPRAGSAAWAPASGSSCVPSDAWTRTR